MRSMEEKKAALMRLRGNAEKPERELLQILLELGAPDHLAGHPYTVSAVLAVLEEPGLLRGMSTGLYPRLAAQFFTTPVRVERSIRHLTEVTWLRGDPAVIRDYFGSTVSAARGRPTNREFIARLANAVRQRFRDRPVC